MSGEQDLTHRVPGFEELDVSLHRHWAEHRRHFVTDEDASEHANGIQNLRFSYNSALDNLPPANRYPIYPVRGHDTSDPSLNIFHGQGFTSQGVFAEHDVIPLAGCQLPNRLENGHANDVSPSAISIHPPPDTAPVQETAQRQSATPPTGQHHRTITRKIIVSFSDVAAHTAKCDDGNERNRDGMSRCNLCGWQICRACINQRAGDRSHSSFGSEHIEEDSRRRQASSVTRQGTLGTGSRPEGQRSVGARAAERCPSARGAGSGGHTSAEDRAAGALVRLGSGHSAGPIPSPPDGERAEVCPGNIESTSETRNLPLRGRRRTCNETEWSDSEITLSSATNRNSGSDSAVGTSDEPEVPIGDNGLPVDYRIARRNPTRRARPATRMAE
ncbi:hypothetical protein PENANT_c016G02702 [Penicillium antarcticum]|uniref:Uncharacterized protein n=1 Tax=Penicillium antarcticum TaxID=416450 RepID=A0A1V6Q2U1_9EURO|nr:uncharacterized protein N7508_001384 [Penicillium antarcticum]KAJ5316876.1 hypothetical protein N7508_001384 [Penicillium antarcticum]OQD83551.1 hypothetical protein PENANT_c016G02702 [Penicillium antarcticum]